MADVQRSSYGAVMVDDSSACDKTEYMSVEIQYMLDGKRHHAFVRLEHVPKADSMSLYNALVWLPTTCTLHCSNQIIKMKPWLMGLYLSRPNAKASP